MKFGSVYILILVGALLILSCERPPELPSVPIISYENLKYIPSPNGQNILALTIGFMDNEGDLGIPVTGNNSDAIYYPLDNNDNPIRYGSSPDLPPYHVCDYSIRKSNINGDEITDTLLVRQVEHHNNIFIKFYRKVRGNFEFFDFKRELPSNCFSFDGRFLRINTQDYDRPLQGSLTYNMPSSMFGTIFRVTDTLKIEVQIRDNALNYSNIVETPEFTLEGILQIE